MSTCLDAPSHADPSWLASSRGGGSNVGRGKGLVDGLSLGGGVLSVSVVDLLAHLLGQGELNGLTGGVRQAGDALLEGLGDNLDLRDGDALLLGGPRRGRRDGLVDTGPDGLRVDDINGGRNNGEDGDAVPSLLGDILAVVVAVSVVGGMVNHWGSMVNSMVGHRGVVDSMVSHSGSMDSMVGHRGSMDSMASLAAEGCEGSELGVLLSPPWVLLSRNQILLLLQLLLLIILSGSSSSSCSSPPPPPLILFLILLTSFACYHSRNQRVSNVLETILLVGGVSGRTIW